MDRVIKIFDQDIKYDVDFRKIKYPRLEFKTGNLLLVLPHSSKNVEGILKRHQKWIYKKNRFINNALQDIKNKKLNHKRNEKEFRYLVNSSVKNFSNELGLRLNKIFFRKMCSKWGSLSSRKNLSINTLLRYLPSRIIKYVIFHEMVHLLERRHNDRFWYLVSAKYKGHQNFESTLLRYWFLIKKEEYNG